MSNETPTKVYMIQGNYKLVEYDVISVNGNMMQIVRTDPDGWKTIRHESVTRVNESAYMAFNADDLADEVDRLRELYEPREGYINCTYCGKVVPEEKATKYKVISYANYGPRGRWGKYCDRQCASHDQMAHEG